MKPVSDSASVTGCSGAATACRVSLPALPRFIASIDGRARPKRAKQPTWLHQANGYCRCSPVSICTTTPCGSSVPSGVTTVTPASASASSGSFRMLTSATGLSSLSSASWYMKHSLPSGAQRTCQSPKVSRITSITSPCGGASAASPSAGAAASGAAPAAGASAAGARRSLARRAGAGVSAAGASGAGGVASWAATGAASAAATAAAIRRVRIGCISASHPL